MAGVMVSVIVSPRSSKNVIVGLAGEPQRLKVKLAAPPVDGEANEALIEYFSKLSGLPKSKLVLVRGETSKKKDIFFAGFTKARLLQILKLD